MGCLQWLNYHVGFQGACQKRGHLKTDFCISSPADFSTKNRVSSSRASKVPSDYRSPSVQYPSLHRLVLIQFFVSPATLRFLVLPRVHVRSSSVLSQAYVLEPRELLLVVRSLSRLDLLAVLNASHIRK